MEKRIKKIAFVSDTIYPFFKGGKEKRGYDISTRLAKEGYDVTIYCMKWWKEPEQEIVQEGVRFYAISPQYPIYSGERRSIKEAIFFALHCLKLFGKDFDVIDIDHMPHLVLFTTKIVCVLKRKKMIVTWNEVWGKEYWKKYLGWAGTLAFWIEWMSARLPDIIISISPNTTNALRETLKVKQPIFTVAIGVDYEAILAIPPSSRTSDIIYAGRLLIHKNVDVLLRALSILIKKDPTLSAVIVGDGPEKNNLEALAAELGIEKNVSFLGFLENHDDLYALMKASRVFVLPSTREGFGIVAIEANACGLPIITIDYDRNASKDLVIEGENGALCPLDKDSLAHTVSHVLQSRKDPEAYRTYAERYNWRSIIAEIQNVYFP